ncbi:hypothetical protein MTO96_011155 [Rhipicephalus appendiculatus]
MNTDGGTVTFHPKLHKSGMVLLEILGNLFPSAWRPLLRISHVLVEIKSLLSAHPYVNVPSLSAEMWLSDAVFYYHLAQHETMRVAVCDAVEACLNGTSQCPPELRNVMMRLFLEHYDHYEAIVESNKDLSGGHYVSTVHFLIVRGRELPVLHAAKSASATPTPGPGVPEF